MGKQQSAIGGNSPPCPGSCAQNPADSSLRQKSTIVNAPVTVALGGTGLVVNNLTVKLTTVNAW